MNHTVRYGFGYMARKTRQDWLETGLHILATQGATAVTTEALTQHMAMTKGSFYHHFPSLPEYKKALLQFFEEKGTRAIIRALEPLPTPAAKLRGLFELVLRMNPDVETAVRAWAMQDTEARLVQERVDSQRVAYVQSLCIPFANNEAHATLMAQMTYVILIGSAQIHPPLNATDLRQLFDEFLRLYQIE